MRSIIVIICKIISFILNRFGGGSIYPGDLALRLDKDILSYFQLPKITICVTGTAGKTSISGTLAELYRDAGFKVGHNAKGSNTKTSVVTTLIQNSNIFGKIKADVLVLEVDERYIKQVLKVIKPNYLIISNLSRDQLARHGHFDIVWNYINTYIDKSTHLILNADDPLTSKFSLEHKGKTTFYGVKKTKYSYKHSELNNLDILYCPKCHKKLKFNYFHYGNLGNYQCLNCDFQRGEPKYEAELISDNCFKVDDIEIKMNNTAIYNVYNLLACYAVVSDSGVASDQIVTSLNNLSLNVKRLDTFKVGNKECVLLISKNETPISYNQSLDYISKQEGIKTVIIGFNRISGRYNLKDLSWLWDIKFELLNEASIDKVICIGNFANDLAVRLKYANIDQNKIIVCLSSEEILNMIKKYTKEKVYCMLYFDVEKTFKRLLKKEV
ncbi:MAG: MurT ligase domain-containing protein [Bacilli bacterium]|nr:MurT ligase domain-containing protein [Bacilli bacterium]MDD4298639.1 MurT ligase domain-containing protein [Bacilli bacterium]MDD4643500.1 MurT ligase domain-containing protein [Bacilli bacterium]